MSGYADLERNRLATLRNESSADWTPGDFVFLMDALERAWEAIDKARTAEAKANETAEHWKGLVTFERDLHAKALKDRAEWHQAEIRKVMELTGHAATAWNRIIAARSARRKTVRLEELLEGIDL